MQPLDPVPPLTTHERDQAHARVVRRAGIVAFFTLLSRILGYARDAVLANVFGASAIFDAFVVAQTIPNFFRRLVAEGGLVIAFVPILTEEKARGGNAHMRRFFSAVLGLLIPILVVLVLLGVFFPDLLVDFFAPGFPSDTHGIASRLTRIMMPYVFFISLMALAGGVLNVEGVFAPVAAAPILLNIAIIGFAIFLREQFASPIEAAAWGLIVGGVLQLLLQWPGLLKKKLIVAPRWAPRDPAVMTLLRRMGPAIFGIAVYQINILVIRQIGSFLPEGQLTCYYNATRLQEFALGIFAVSMSVAALPTLSEHAAHERWDELLRTFRAALKATNFVTVPATIVLLFLSGPIVGLLFRHGEYTIDASTLTAEVLVLLGLAVVPIGAARVAIPTFYALGDTKTPVRSGVWSLAAMFALGFLLRERFLIHGLALATSAAACVQLVVLWRSLRRAIGARQDASRAANVDDPNANRAAPDESVIRHALRCAVASVPGTIVAWALSRQFDWNLVTKIWGGALLLGSFAIIVSTYFLGARLLRIEEGRLIVRAVLRRLRPGATRDR